MKLLIFEYVTGGGYCRENIPDSLAAEGLLMLNALLRDCHELTDVDLVLMLDERLVGKVNIPDACRNVIYINGNDDFFAILERLIHESDSVWPVAPEIDDILLNIIRLVEQQKKILLASGSKAVELTTDKLKTYQHLTRHKIPTVPTKFLNSESFKPDGSHVIKPIDGMGCEETYFIENGYDWQAVKSKLSPGRGYIVQPFVQGQPKSISCLFRDGQVWLICINSQVVKTDTRQFKLVACIVNETEPQIRFKTLVADVARAIPELWGYVGIDFIDSGDEIQILEINPRLTSSYSGVYQAVGINVAELVLQMLTHEPFFNVKKTQSIEVFI